MLGCISYRWTRPHVTYTDEALFCAVSEQSRQAVTKNGNIHDCKPRRGFFQLSFMYILFSFNIFLTTHFRDVLSFEPPLDHTRCNSGSAHYDSEKLYEYQTPPELVPCKLILYPFSSRKEAISLVVKAADLCNQASLKWKVTWVWFSLRTYSLTLYPIRSVPRSHWNDSSELKFKKNQLRLKTSQNSASLFVFSLINSIIYIYI